MILVNTEPRTGALASTVQRVVWAALLALTTLATLVVLFTTPFSAQEGEFIHALRAGEVGSIVLGSSSSFQSDTGLTTSSSSATNDIAVSWVNRFGFRRVAVLPGLKGLDNVPPQNGGISSGSARGLDAAGSITATARSLGAASPTIIKPGTLLLDRIAKLPSALIFLMVVVMLCGPQPRRMTRWGAFWAYTAPLNVGIFYALLRDSPWNKKMNLVPEPRAGDRFALDQATGRTISRLGGWNMFFWASFLGKFAISLVLLAVTWALPEFVDTVVLTGVDMGGNQLSP